MREPRDASRSPLSFSLPVASLAVVLLLLLACSPWPTQQAARQPDVYVLEKPQHLPAADSADSYEACHALTVETPDSAPGFDTARMAYIKRPYEIEYFAYNRWADTPARMFAPLLVATAEESRLFTAVIPEGVAVEADLRLQSRLLYLQQVFHNESSEVQLALRVQVLNIEQNRIVLSRTLSVSVPAEAQNPYAGVVAANRAAERLLRDLVGVLGEHAQSLACRQDTQS